MNDRAVPVLAHPGSVRVGEIRCSDNRLRFVAYDTDGVIVGKFVSWRQAEDALLALARKRKVVA